MEELHKIHKDIPYGYWSLWVAPALLSLSRRWRERRPAPLPGGLHQASGPH